MAEPKIILGINGSPRRANTDLLLDEVLKSAETVPGIATEKIYLRKQKIEFCLGCFKCFEANDNDLACQVHRDAMDEINLRLAACSGLILATPVYFGQVTAQMKTFMDRTEPLLRYAQGRWQGTLRDKIGAAVAMGGNRNGGQETTIQAIHHFFFIHDMMVVGTGSQGRPGCYLGAAATTYPQRGRVRDAILGDEQGLEAARQLGLRIGRKISPEA